MKKQDIHVGSVYVASYRWRRIVVRVDAIRRDDSGKRAITLYDVTWLESGRKDTFTGIRFLAPTIPPYPRNGDEAWLVEWVAELAFDANGDVDWNNCKEAEQLVATREQAEELARKVYPQTVGKTGCVHYRLMRFGSPWGGPADWHRAGDTEEYAGE